MHAAIIYDAGGDDKLMFFFTGLRLIGLVTIYFMFKFLFGRKDDLTQKTSKIDFYWDMV
jgi:hypothetical protein